MVETIKELIPPHLFQAAIGEVISYFVASKIHAAPPHNPPDPGPTVN
jgi:hypothetical protein